MQLELFTIEYAEDENGILCRDCNLRKPRQSFRLYRRATGDRECRSTSCKDCQRKHNQVVNRIRKTAPKMPKNCEACGKEHDKLVLDHCHETETFRGWLCSPCNLALGTLGDSVERVEKALYYLKHSKDKRKET